MCEKAIYNVYKASVHQTAVHQTFLFQTAAYEMASQKMRTQYSAADFIVRIRAGSLRHVIYLDLFCVEHNQESFGQGFRGVITGRSCLEIPDRWLHRMTLDFDFTIGTAGGGGVGWTLSCPERCWRPKAIR